MSSRNIKLIERDVERIIRRMRQVGKYTRTESRKLGRAAAKHFKSRAAANAPVHSRVHKRKNKAGQVVATYHPGNLKRSIKTMSFRKSYFMHVAPKVANKQNPGSATGVFNSLRRVDGFYGGWVEFGTLKQKAQPFMRRTVTSEKGAVSSMLITAFKKDLKARVAKARRTIQ